MTRFGFVRLILCLCVFVFSVSEASALDATLSGDASVNSAHPGVNYGALSNLYVGNGNTTFLQFDLSSLPAGTTAAQVSRATLTVFVNRVNTAGAVTVSPVTAGWGEYSITSASAPAAGGSIGSLPVSVAGQFVSVDVTAQVQAWVNTPASNNGLVLASSAANVLLDSKENDETGHAARLDVTLVSQGPIGPAGPVGATGAAGLPGAQGIQGPVGPAGVAGATGTAGATGPQGPPVTFQGTWSNTTTYALGDAVFFNGSSYISLVNSNTGNQPSTAPAQWSLLAQQGATGTIGPAGPIGPIGPMGATGLTGPVGPTGATGSQGIQGVQGLTGQAGPIGATGATGAVGPQGPPVTFQGPWSNATTYALGDAVFFNGSSYISLVSGNVGFQPDISNVKWALLAQAGATGPAGAAGAAGAQGPAGVAGPTGPTGPAGATGATGPAGPAGSGINAVSFSMEFTNPGTGAAGTKYFFSPLYASGPYTGNTTIGGNFVAMPVVCTMSALNVGVNNYNTPGADVTTLTVYKNGSVTGMTCSVTTNNNGSSCQDNTHTFAVSGGDNISVAFSESNLAPFNKVVVNLVCQ